MSDECGMCMQLVQRAAGYTAYVYCILCSQTAFLREKGWNRESSEYLRRDARLRLDSRLRVGVRVRGCVCTRHEGRVIHSYGFQSGTSLCLSTKIGAQSRLMGASLPAYAT